MPKPTKSVEYLNPDGTILTSDPRFHAWRDTRYQEIQARQNELSLRLAKVQGQITSEMDQWAAERRRNRVQEHAEALLEGKDRPDFRNRPDLTALHEERDALGHALLMSQKRLVEVECQVSAEICRGLHRAHLALQREIIPVLVRLGELREIESRFYEALDLGGTRNGYLRQLGFRGENASGNARAIVEEAREFYGADLSECLNDNGA